MEPWGRDMCLDLSGCAQDVKIGMCVLTKEKHQWRRILISSRQDDPSYAQHSDSCLNHPHID